MKRSTKFAIVGVSVTALILAGGYLALLWLFPVKTLTEITKSSPDRKHTARLVTREAGFDVNAILEVDGVVLYTSPDFVAPAKADFQERIMWDRSGQVVLLEVAGKRLFGYDLTQRRPLSASELLTVELTSFDDLRFTEEVPFSSPEPATQ